LTDDHQSAETENQPGAEEQNEGDVGEYRDDVHSTTMPIEMECKWFILTNAPGVNKTFKKLIESQSFVDVMSNFKKTTIEQNLKVES